VTPARDGARPPGQAPAPEPLPGDALDAHCHLDLIEQPLGEVLAAARAASITRVVTVGVDVPTSQWSAKCAATEEGVYAAVAVHPNETVAAASSAAGRDEVLAEIAALGLPALIVPICEVADDHQLANARAFADRTGAAWAREADWDEAAVAKTLAHTLGGAEAWTTAAARMRAAARPGAAAAVVDACERMLATRRSGEIGEPIKAAPRRSAKR